MKEAATEGWTTRALERQINTLYYERLLASSDRSAVEREASGAIAPLQTPRDFVSDPVMLEFLGLPGVGRLLEADLERALLDNLQSFLMELGRGFAFYNYLLKCFVLFDRLCGPPHNPIRHRRAQGR
jgi:predicted nuclease of restriction endonuclease-like (RecB) superfamily